MQKYKTDSDIEKEFDDCEIINLIFFSDSAGTIELKFPEGGEHVGGGCVELCDNFTIYRSGKIAFTNWYPEKIYKKLSSAVFTHYNLIY